MELGGKASNRAAWDVVGHREVGIVGRVISHGIMGNSANRAPVWDRGGCHWYHAQRVAEHLHVLGTVNIVDAVVVADQIGSAASVA